MRIFNTRSLKREKCYEDIYDSKSSAYQYLLSQTMFYSHKGEQGGLLHSI